MTISRHNGPQNGLKLVGEELNRRRHMVQLTSPLGGSITATAPLPVYQIKLNDAYQSNPLELASLSGWFYALLGKDAPSIAQVQEKGNDLVYGGVMEGDLPSQVIEACNLAEKVLGGESVIYEPRILMIHALRFAALWLHGKDDFIIPLLEGNPLGSTPLRIVSQPSAFIRMAANEKRNSPIGGYAPTN